MPDAEAIRTRAQQVLEQIRAAERAAGRAEGEVTLVAVSKRHPAAAVEAAHAAGLRCFGENYVQELVTKAQALAQLAELRWHHIGPLQRNKVNAVLRTNAVLHGVDRVSLVDALAAAAERQGRTVDILLQVNVGGEASKSGCAPQALGELLAAARAHTSLSVRGLMAIPPPAQDEAEARGYFAQLRALRDAHGGAEQLPDLSMGMSADYRAAIAEGATLVRVGTAIFGPRP